MSDAGHFEAALNRLIPAIDDLPAAGDMDLAADIRRMATDHAPYGVTLTWFEAQLAASGDFTGSAPAQQDAAIRAIEAADVPTFNHLLGVGLHGLLQPSGGGCAYRLAQWPAAAAWLRSAGLR